MAGAPWCHGHHPGRSQERGAIASAGGRAQARDRSRPATDNPWSDIGEAEQAARDRAVAQANTRAGALDIVIDTMAKRLKDDKPLPDLQRSRDALRSARTRQAWAEWHRAQAQRHRATLDDLVAHHEGEARRLGGPM